MKYNYTILNTKIEQNSIYSSEYIWLICKNALGGGTPRLMYVR